MRVTCDVAYLCANSSLPRPLCSRLRPDVRDRQTSDAHHRLMPPPYGAGHNKSAFMIAVAVSFWFRAQVHVQMKTSTRTHNGLTAGTAIMQDWKMTDQIVF